MNPTPKQPFHRDDLDPNLNQLVDDFLIELDRLLLQPLKRKARREKKAGKP